MCSSSVGNIPEQIQYKQRRLYFAVFAGNFLQDMVINVGVQKRTVKPKRYSVKSSKGYTQNEFGFVLLTKHRACIPWSIWHMTIWLRNNIWQICIQRETDAVIESVFVSLSVRLRTSL